MADRIGFTTPAGRMVGGDCYKGNTTDMDGNPLLVKSGANIGQPRTNFYVGQAVPKNHQYMMNQQTGLELTNDELKAGMQGMPTMFATWQETPWGVKVMQVARTGVPNAFDPNSGQLYQGRSFSFKVTDGDSNIPNEKQKKPCDQEGYAGNWVLHFSNGFAPKICNADGSSYIVEPDAVKRGYYIQVACNVGANNHASKPGVFLNHELVALAGYGEEIHSGVDASQAGFGGGALPQGASATPLGAMNQHQANPTMNQQQAPPQQMNQQLAPPPPATDLVEQQAPPQQVEAIYSYNGQNYNESVLLAMPGWTPAHLAGLQRVN